MSLGSMEGVQRDGLPIGELAPTVTGVTPQGLIATFTPQLQRSELLLFASLNCRPCETILPTVDHLASGRGHQFTVTTIVVGLPEEAAELVNKFAPNFNCFAEAGSGAADRYRVRVTPFAFVIGPDGRILAKGLCSDVTKLRDLLLAGGLAEEATSLKQTIPLIPRDPGVVGAREVS
jgi:hypothetical protein